MTLQKFSPNLLLPSSNFERTKCRKNVAETTNNYRETLNKLGLFKKGFSVSRTIVIEHDNNSSFTVTSYQLPVTSYQLSVIRNQLSVISFWSLFTVHWSLFTVHWSLFTGHCFKTQMSKRGTF
ncbi:hypothetical protein NIES2130_13275 [Scytonema sp. HK-05]|nr:hypothetical protein NIES2130_13275 [Scytonema sp. HK-05]